MNRSSEGGWEAYHCDRFAVAAGIPDPHTSPVRDTPNALHTYILYLLFDILNLSSPNNQMQLAIDGWVGRILLFGKVFSESMQNHSRTRKTCFTLGLEWLCHIFSPYDSFKISPRLQNPRKKRASIKKYFFLFLNGTKRKIRFSYYRCIFQQKKWGSIFSWKKDQTPGGGSEGGLVKDHPFPVFFFEPFP